MNFEPYIEEITTKMLMPDLLKSNVMSPFARVGHQFLFHFHFLNQISQTLFLTLHSDRLLIPRRANLLRL